MSLRLLLGIEALTELAQRHIGDATEVRELRRLSGGANQETWSFDAVGPDGRHGLTASGDYTARIVSFAVAVTVTWYLNRQFAFSTRKTIDRRSEYSRYLTVQGIGMAINFIVYSLCIASSETMDRWPVLALAVGSGVALIFNFVGSRKFVFTGDPR